MPIINQLVVFVFVHAIRLCAVPELILFAGTHVGGDSFLVSEKRSDWLTPW